MITTLLVGLVIGAIVLYYSLQMYKNLKKKFARIKKQIVLRIPRKKNNYPSYTVTIGNSTFLIQQESSMDGYSRDMFGQGLATRSNGISVRDKMLIRDANFCRKNSLGKPESGQWTCPYFGFTLTDLSKVEVDHVVPLAEAWRSGAKSWSLSKRTQYAIDPEVLISVSRAANREKSDKDISQWVPPHDPKGFVIHWLYIKKKYGLSLDQEEYNAILKLL